MKLSAIVRFVIALAATVLPVAVYAAPAHANWFGATGLSGACSSANITDNKSVTFVWIDLQTDVHDAAGYTRTQLLDPTDLDTSVVDTQTDQTDVVVLDRYYTDYCEAELGVQWTTDAHTGLFGLESCGHLGANTGDRCGQASVRVSNVYTDYHSDPSDRYLLCHEIGHAIGLRHRHASGCMENCAEASAASYTQHDIDHFNSNWGTEPASGTEPVCP